MSIIYKLSESGSAGRKKLQHVIVNLSVSCCDGRRRARTSVYGVGGRGNFSRKDAQELVLLESCSSINLFV